MRDAEAAEESAEDTAGETAEETAGASAEQKSRASAEEAAEESAEEAADHAGEASLTEAALVGEQAGEAGKLAKDSEPAADDGDVVAVAVPAQDGGPETVSTPAGQASES